MCNNHVFLKSLLSLSLLANLTACTSMTAPPVAAETDLGRFTLSQPLMIPAERVHVLIQHGQVVERADRNEPICRLESWQKLAEPQNVQADNFRIASISEQQGDTSQGFGFFGSNDAGIGVGVGFRLGAFNLGVGGGQSYGGVGGVMGDTRTAQSMMQFRIVSLSQPDIYQLSCFSAESWATSLDMLTIAQINATLGEIAHVHLGASGASSTKVEPVQ